MAPHRTKWHHTEPSGTTQNQVAPHRTKWHHTEPSGTTQNQVAPHRTKWHHTEPRVKSRGKMNSRLATYTSTGFRHNIQESTCPQSGNDSLEKQRNKHTSSSTFTTERKVYKMTAGNKCRETPPVVETCSTKLLSATNICGSLKTVFASNR